MNQPSVSLIVPIYNEEESINGLHKRLLELFTSSSKRQGAILIVGVILLGIILKSTNTTLLSIRDAYIELPKSELIRGHGMSHNLLASVKRRTNGV